MKRMTGAVVVAAAMVCAVVVWSGPAEAGIDIGHLDGTRESFGLTGYIGGAAADLGVFGHTLSATAAITNAFLGTVDAFYLGLLPASLSGPELTALVDFVNAGKFLFIQQDWGVAPWSGPANDALDAFGAHAVETLQGDDVHTVEGTHPIATTPNALTGDTFTGAAHSFFDVFTEFDVIARDGSGDPTVIHRDYDSGGHVVSSSDIDMWSSAGGYGSDPNNRRLWENIWNFAENHHGGVQNGVIPEPSTMLLFGIGLSGAAARALRRR